MPTNIEWTNESWNPIIGCLKISSGCDRCYAEIMANRLANMAIKNVCSDSINKYVKVIQGGKWDGTTYLNHSELTKPMNWKKPRKIFVCSMGDLFHESVPFEWIDKVMKVIYFNQKHIFQVLTKRPDVAVRYYKSRKNGWINQSEMGNPLKNLWIGVSVENQATANRRIPELLKIPVSVRFLSCEPLLGEIHLEELSKGKFDFINCLRGSGFSIQSELDVPNDRIGVEIGGFRTNRIDWIIAGPETGHGARPMKREWIESLYFQCKTAGVPFFDKKNILGKNIYQFPNER